MKPAQLVTGLENVFQSATRKWKAWKIVDEWGRFAQIRKGLDQGQVKRLGMIPNDGNSEGHVTKRHENIWWREMIMWTRTAQNHSKDKRNHRYMDQGSKKLRGKLPKVEGMNSV